ncbi:MAG: TPM domain-containing protein [Erythrobacter sp.]|uniref:TPM domain-containing protein n=1 Tax=Erythrobacter sp. TaxID=1042 RepID=UPI0032F04E8E
MFALAGTLLASASAVPLAAQKISLEFDGAIADGAEIFSEAFEERTNSRIARIEDRAQVSILLMTVPSLEGADSAVVAETVGDLMSGADKIRAHWVVFLIAPTEREFSGALYTPVDLPEGTAIEDVVSEREKRVLAEQVEQAIGSSVAPFFKDGRWEEGMRAGLDALEAKLDQAVESDSENSGRSLS